MRLVPVSLTPLSIFVSFTQSLVAAIAWMTWDTIINWEDEVRHMLSYHVAVIEIHLHRFVICGGRLARSDIYFLAVDSSCLTQGDMQDGCNGCTHSFAMHRSSTEGVAFHC